MKHRTRRRFLKGLGAAGLALPQVARSLDLAAPSVLPGRERTEGASLENPDTAEAPRPLGYAEVGIGALAIGQVLPALAKTKRSRLTGLVSSHPDKARHFAYLYGVPEKNIYDYRNFDQMASNPDIDVVYIALPNSLHAEYTVRAAKAGKHVLCEKPMATTVRDAETMIAACRETRRRLMIAYRLRYEPYTLAAIEMCRENRLGRIKMMDAEFAFVIGDPSQWRLKRDLAGGGALMDIGIYCLQAARVLTGEEPASVTAQAWSFDAVKFKEVEENIAFTLTFPSGVIANCYSSYGIDSMERFRVGGSDGWLEMEPAYGYTSLVKRSYRDGEITTTAPSTWDQFATEIDAFSDAILNNRDPVTPGEEGLRDMKIMMACYESARTVKTVLLA